MYKRVRNAVFTGIGFAVLFFTSRTLQMEAVEVYKAGASVSLVYPAETVQEIFILEKFDALGARLEGIISDAEGTWSIYIKDLESDIEFSLNDREMYAASLIKLYVMESVYENMEMVVENSDEEHVEEMLADMITVSDNEAYNELVRLHSSSLSFAEGCRFIENNLESSIYRHTDIYHTLHPSYSEEVSIENKENTTCVNDCGRLLETIYDGECVSADASEAMLYLLFAQEVTTKIPAGVPEGTPVANKTGETDEVQHDAAIIFGPERDYILCIMSENITDIESAVFLIQNISSEVYLALNEE